ncbi:DUF4235 domain-containing protein [Paeniglutamicibacter kerguelensis]|uniref:DUF4235 domain-containing protein n=1 Tax=Paeniglutamicibacter kerguelensis TaxID=254788 RepID=A0ABS4XCP8_9MICC|nr:DUF4235 domain-containing protein [Paeniglutamicibacter kerguelensis]MBP2386234.1 hypothetical protein [Paeniglutamicibacter kerguelensis]
MKIQAKVFGTVVSLLAGLLGTKVVSAVWTKITGEEPPTPANPTAQQRATLGKVLVFAVISGASAACIQAITNRWTRKLADKSQRH